MSKHNEHFVVWSKRLNALYKQQQRSNNTQSKSKRSSAPTPAPEPAKEGT
jgi:hypothetical protein